MADGCNSVDKSNERMDTARYAGGALGNRCGNDLSDPVNSEIHVTQKKNLRGSDKMRRQSRTSGANSPDIAGEPLGKRVHEFLVLRSRSWRRGSDRGDLLPRGLFGDNLVHLTVLWLLIAMIYSIRLPTQIGVCRIDGGLDVIGGDSTIYEVSKRGGSDGSDRAGARIILVGVRRWVLQEGTERSKFPSENLVVALNRADVHHIIIFRVMVDGPICLSQKWVSCEKGGRRRREGGKVGYHVSRTVAAAVCVWPVTTSKRSDGRKTRLRANSFNDARVGRGGQPLRKTRVRNGRLFFPNAMGTMRGRALNIERVKGVGGWKRGVSCRVRVTLEFVSGVGWWTGVRWDGDWHLAKEGLGLSVSQAPAAGTLET